MNRRIRLLSCAWPCVWLCAVTPLSVTAGGNASLIEHLENLEQGSYDGPMHGPDVSPRREDFGHLYRDGGPPPQRGGFELSVGAIREVASGSSALFASGGTALQAWQDFRGGMEALNELDAALDSNINDDGDGPQVPSSCADDISCNACFNAAYSRVNFVRITLERLRTIHTRTINFIEKWESFGDTVSPIHGMSGLAWQSSKAGIEKERERFNQTSMNKYEQLIDTMRSALENVGRCEAEHFDNPDWESRYGFMYLQAIKTAYRPNDG